MFLHTITNEKASLHAQTSQAVENRWCFLHIIARIRHDQVVQMHKVTF